MHKQGDSRSRIQRPKTHHLSEKTWHSIILCSATFCRRGTAAFPFLSLSSYPLSFFLQRYDKQELHNTRLEKNLLCASQQPNSNSSNDPLSATDYLMKWEMAIMAIFTTYLDLTWISIPKEKYEKYRFIACLCTQAWIICDYTFYSYFQTGIS